MQKSVSLSLKFLYMCKKSSTFAAANSRWGVRIAYSVTRVIPTTSIDG